MRFCNHKLNWYHIGLWPKFRYQITKKFSSKNKIRKSSTQQTKVFSPSKNFYANVYGLLKYVFCSFFPLNSNYLMSNFYLKKSASLKASRMESEAKD